MKLLAFIAWATLALPVLIVLTKAAGLLKWSWTICIGLATGIPVMVFLGFLLLSVFLIKQYPDEYWTK